LLLLVLFSLLVLLVLRVLHSFASSDLIILRIGARCAL
jgi:hypothetical protein